MARRAMVLVFMLAWQAGALARCPPPRDADLLAAGGAIVTGEIFEIGPPVTGSGPPYPAWARLRVTQRHAGAAPQVVRLVATEAGLYTRHLVVGGTTTLAISNPFGVSGVTMCDGRQAPVGG